MRKFAIAGVAALAIVGSTAADKIEIKPTASNSIEVYLTEGAAAQEFLGTFNPTGQVVILPRAGDRFPPRAPA